MSDFQAIADRVEIEALRGEFTDALMMRDYDRFASLFTQDGAWRISSINADGGGSECMSERRTATCTNWPPVGQAPNGSYGVSPVSSHRREHRSMSDAEGRTRA